jgi:FAD/FMN-containing dehydrogenase
MVTATAVDHSAIEALRASVAGPVFRDGDDGYDAVRAVWNGMIQLRPRLIVRCTGTADVIKALSFARDNDLEIAVRGGGHNVAGKSLCADGLLIDCSMMKGILVDPTNRTVRAQTGVLWGELDRETQVFGLATPGGVVSTTGIAGLTLGGGFGWLMRKHGLTCDNVLSFNVVTADGTALVANEADNTDLFWALRGGGANFGVVTSIDYRLHPVGPIVMGGMALHPWAHARDVLRFYRDFTSTAPDELTTYAGLLHTPDGTPAAGIVVCYAGPVEDGERAVRPVKEFGSPVADLIGPMPFVDHQQIFDAGFPPGNLYYEKSSFLPDLSDDAIDVLVAQYEQAPSPMSFVVVEHHGGAIRRVDPDATAFAHREPEYNLIPPAVWTDPASSEMNIGWERRLWDLMQPYSTGASYVNYMSEGETEERVRGAYGDNYSRLATLKGKYDPTNVFHLNQNIKPS